MRVRVTLSVITYIQKGNIYIYIDKSRVSDRIPGIEEMVEKTWKGQEAAGEYLLLEV